MSWHQMDHADRHSSLVLLMRLDLGKVGSSPFEESTVHILKRAVIADLEAAGWKIERHEEDRSDVPVDYRFLHLLLRVADNPEVGMGLFAWRDRVEPRARMLRLLALFSAE